MKGHTIRPLPLENWKDEFLTWFHGLKGQEFDSDKRVKIIEDGLKVWLKRDSLNLKGHIKKSNAFLQYLQ